MKRLALCGLVVLFASCASNTVKYSENPEEIYNETVRLMESGRYIESQELVTEIRRRFPQSRFAPLAELRNADIYFRQEDYTEAAAAYGVFVELYPTNPDAAYAQYQRALSYFNDAPDNIARDQEPAKNAVSAAETVISRYGKSEYAAKADDIRKKARLRLAEKEAYVARFYAKKGANDAAKNRWKGILIAFPDLKTLPEAQELLKEAGEKSGEGT